jgi:hypothetical protein
MNLDTEVYDVTKSSDRPLQPLSWHQTWMLAITQPSNATFERIARDPNATCIRAYKWIFFTALAGALIFHVFYRNTYAFPGQEKPEIPLNTGTLIVELAVIFFCLQTFMTDYAATLFHGSGEYHQTAYDLAAFYAPLYLLIGLVSGISMMSWLLIPILIYGIVLGIIAVKAVHRIRWWQATISFSIPFVLAIGFVALMILL